MNEASTNKGFTKQHSNVTKGLAIILLLFHHVFYDQFVLGNSNVQVFLFQPISEVLCRYGYICIFVFATISGYGISKSMEKNDDDIRKTIIDREINLLGTFIPVFIISSILYILFNKDGINTYLITYGLGQYNAISIAARIFISMMGLSKIFHVPDFNATWWYMSAAHIIILVLPLLIKIAKKCDLKYIPLIILAGYCAYSKAEYPPLSCCLLASYVGFCLSDSKIFNMELDITKKILVLISSVFVILISVCLLETLSGYFVFAFLGITFMLIVKYCMPKLLYRPLEVIGRYSDVIFMVHTLFVSLIEMTSSLVSGFKYAVLSYGLVFFLSLGTSVVVRKLLSNRRYLSFIAKTKEKLYAIR